MKKMKFTLFGLLLISFCSCDNELIQYEKGDLKVTVEQGDGWLHDFPLFMGIKKRNPPQIAVWLEDIDGNYLADVYVTHKIAAQAWQSAGGNRRKESLPHWCYARGVRYEDGLYLPTKKNPLPDGITGATPHTGFDVKLKPSAALKQFVVKIEVNHSTDFNESYPESAKEGGENYSGGKGGSGQPALVYAARVDLSSGGKSFQAVPVGYSSPDGSCGDLYDDLSGLTSALTIVKRITITVQ